MKFKFYLKKVIAVIVAITVMLPSIFIDVWAMNNETQGILENIEEDATVGAVDIEENITETQAQKEVDVNDNIITTSSVAPIEKKVVGDGYEVCYYIDEMWEEHYNVTVTIFNTGTEKIENWALQYIINGKIENLWNASIYKQENDLYILKNLRWNQDIEVGESVEFGYTIQTDVVNLPEDVNILSNVINVEESKYDALYDITNSWGSGLNAVFIITNTGVEEIEDWILEFDYPNEIININNAEIIEHSGNHYIIKNTAYSQNIEVGSFVTIDVVVEVNESTNENVLINNVKMQEVKTEIPVEKEYGITIETTALIMDEETGVYTLNCPKNSVTGEIRSFENVKKAYITVTNDKGMLLFDKEFVPVENFVVDDFGLMLGNNYVSAVVEYDDGTVKEDNIVIVNYSEENMDNLNVDYTDIDRDGLDGYLEELYGTDINNADSDEDGLSDYEELVVIGTNPNLPDSDNDGVLDGDGDIDSDGLTNAQEALLGTDNTTRDSDFDVLSDYDEYVIYNTNPLNSDTDGDGADDRWEIDNNFNPNTWDDKFTLNDIIKGDGTSIEIDITATGDVIDSFRAIAYENDLFLNSTIPGYLGSAFDFCIDGEFQSAVLKYYFDEEYIDEEFNPVVYYYNEELQELEEIPTIWDGTSNYVTAELPHFSTYILLNKTELEQVWKNEIISPDKIGEGVEKFNVVFVVDLSGSMYAGGKLSTTKKVINSFIDVLGEYDNCGLVSFTNYATILCNLTNDKDRIKKEVNYMEADGLTSIYTGIEKAVTMLSDDNTQGYDMIIVVTDGYDEPSTTYEGYYANIVNSAVENNIVIYTVGIETINESLLKKVAETTGGSYYYANMISDLQEQMDSIKEETIDIYTDSNNDGISDYYTKLLCEGKLTTGTGSMVTYIPFEKIQENDDYDQDGLKNGEEVKIIDDGKSVKVIIESDMTQKDSDYDGVDDLEELKNGSNAMRRTASVFDVDTLMNDELYLSAIYADEYVHSDGIKFKLYAGNIITNSKFTYVNDYKKALLTYITTYSDTTLVNLQYEIEKGIYRSNINQVILDLVEYRSALLNISKESSDYAKAILIIDECNAEIDGLNTMLKELEVKASMNSSFSDDLLTRYTKISALVEESKSELKASKELLSNTSVSDNLAKHLGEFVNAMPTKLKYAISIWGKVGEVFEYGTIIVDSSLNIYDAVMLYSAIDAETLQYYCVDEVLIDIMYFYGTNSDTVNSPLVSAASDIRLAIADDMYKHISEGGMIMGEFGEGAMQAATALIIGQSKYGATWAIGLGLSIGDLISKTSQVNEEALYVIAYGNAATAVRKAMFNSLVKDTKQYYRISEDNLLRLEMLGQLRVMGEDKFAQMANSRGIVKKWIDDFMSGVSQMEIEEWCQRNIDKVVGICDKLGRLVIPWFEGNYLFRKQGT